MLLKQIEYFCEVARRGSYTKAAEACFVSQSAISQQVKALEADLGVALVQRAGRGFRLTRAGELMAQRGQDVLDLAEQVRFEVTHVDAVPQELRVGYLNRYDGWEVPAAIAAFAQRHPHVTVSATPASHDGLYERVMNGELDILVNDRRRELSDSFENRYLFRGYDYVEVSEASALAWRESVAVPDLHGTACILIAAADQRPIEQAYYRDVVGFDGAFLFADTLEQARMMVAGNCGFLPIESGEGEGRFNAVLRRIPLTDAGGHQRTREYYAFWLKARANPLVEEFSGILEGLFGKAG